MINITDRKKALRIITENNRLMIRYENAMAADIFKMLKKQFNSAAKTLESFSMDYETAVKKYAKEFMGIFGEHYLRVAQTFGDRALESAGFKKVKTPFDEFMAEMESFLSTYTAVKVTQVDNTTVNIIRRIIRKGFDEGLSNQEIAKQVSKRVSGIGAISAKTRAKMIARTEVHQIANNSISKAMKSSRLVRTKQWISVLDSRTRSKVFNHARANGETVNVDEFFWKTGEALNYPGDFYGSPGNIINCRCGNIYHTDIVA